MGQAFTDEEFDVLLNDSLNCQQLAARVHDLIMTREKAWNQPTWGSIFGIDLKKRKTKRGQEVKVVPTCSTTGCVAGWTTQIAGDKMIYEQGYGTVAYNVLTDDGDVYDIGTRGAQLLCLNGEQTWLFGGGRSLSEVLYALEELAAGKKISYASDYDLRMKKWKPVVLEPDPRATNRRVIRTVGKKTAAAKTKVRQA